MDRQKKEPVNLTEVWLAKWKKDTLAAWKREGITEAELAVFDANLAGFYVRLYSNSRMTCGLKFSHNRQQRRLSLGPLVPGALADKRKEAAAERGKVAGGVNVAAVRKEAKRRRETLGEVVQRYLKARKGELRSGTYSDIERYLMKAWEPLHSQPVKELTRAQIVRVRDKVEERGHAAAHNACMALSGLYSWLLERGEVEHSPAIRLASSGNANGKATQPRRPLTEAEMVTVWDACWDNDHDKIVRLLLLTGCRREEISHLEWSEIDFDAKQIVLPAERTKQNREHIIPLSAPALAILRSCPRSEDRQYVFGTGKAGYTGYSAGKVRLDKRITGVRPWTLHELRHTFITLANEANIAPPWIIEACVGHLTGFRAGVAGLYNKAQHLSERREAFNRWCDYVLGLLHTRKDAA